MANCYAIVHSIRISGGKRERMSVGVVSEAKARGAFQIYWVPIALALVAIAAYLPALTQPFISDDYTNILMSQNYGGFSGWGTMMADHVARVRATSWILTYWLNRVFGLSALAFYAVSILLHVLNTWLVYSLNVWRLVEWRVSAFAAAFFAVYEGHQEAVMWYSAANELLQFFFGLLCMLAWIVFVQSSDLRLRYWAGAFAAFLCALASKESAVILVPLLFLPLFNEPQKIKWRILWVLPFLAVAAFYARTIFRTQDYSFRFHDGSFSLHAPFWITLPASFLRTLWPWGFLALASIIALRPRQWWRVVGFSAMWAAISLVPYSFLTYSKLVPSRQTYFASVGAALIVGVAFLAICERLRHTHPSWIYALAALILLHNCIYLWTKKRSQFLARAASTEALVELAQKTDSLIHIPCSPETTWGGCACFPYAPVVAASALQLRTNRPASALIWSRDPQQGAVEFCWNSILNSSSPNLRDKQH